MKPQIRKTALIAMLAALLFVACSDERSLGIAALSDEAYAQTVLDWRDGRVGRLKAPNGYLTLVGLFWLEQGTSTFGAADDNDLVFPSAESEHIGSFELQDDIVTMNVDDDIQVLVDDQRVHSRPMPDDNSDEFVLATHGSLAWGVVKRQSKFGIRLRDYENPSVEALPPIPYYDIDRNWSVAATLKRYDQPRKINVDTVVEGLGWNPESPGIVEFEYEGTTYSLEAYDSGDALFLIFGDGTSGKETYPAGRFLYARKPGDDGKLILDFNRSYNPPCAFNDFATCPVASPRNRLTLAIEAGEKYDKALHFDPPT